MERLIDQLLASRELPSPGQILALLSAQGGDLAALYSAADRVRRAHMGDEVFLRGIIEFSNHCRKNCNYCGIRAGNGAVVRYRMTAGEIIAQAARAAELGCTTVVLQSGEDLHFSPELVCEIVSAIKARSGLALTLSLGERSYEEFRRFRAAGADRYLLRFETSDRNLFRSLHPDDDFDRRLQCLHDLRRAGFQVGSGFLIGLPAAPPAALAEDILFASRLQLDMIGCGPFIPHPDTPLGGAVLLAEREIYFKTIAILRLLNPEAHIPATTAFDTLQSGGRELLLVRGANVFMPNITPLAYRRHYALYPGKSCVDEEWERCWQCARTRIERLGRPIGTGPGHSRVSRGESGPPLTRPTAGESAEERR